MASSELVEALQALAPERKIDEFYLIDRLEASLAKTYQNILDLEWDARVTIDRNTGKIYVYEMVPKGEPDPETGEYSEFEERDVTPDDVSRIAAQNAKSVISSIVREAARQSIYEEFSQRVGDLVTGTVLQGTPTSPSSRSATAWKPSCRTTTSSASPTSATSARPTNGTVTTSA